MTAPLLELRGVSKSFGRTRALVDVGFDLHAGEIHVLAGANGAGKSTLIKLLSGVHRADSGEILLDGRATRFAHPRDAANSGIATIHQELSLVPNLSIADNLTLSARGSVFARVRPDANAASARAALERVGLSLPPERPVAELSLGQKQLLEIARALAQHARILILDEPTSALNDPESRTLFTQLERLRSEGTAIVYISHRMEEIERLADRVTVLRDGRRVLTKSAKELPRADLVRSMVGTDLETRIQTLRDPEPAPPRLQVRRLALEGDRRDVSFVVHPGETLGIAGLAGTGTRSILSSLFGESVAPPDAVLDDAPYAPRSPRAALDRGVVLLAPDRTQSVLGAMSVTANATLSCLARYSRRGIVDTRRERVDVERHATELKLKAASLSAPAEELSGGNQQKVALMRCLMAQPKVLLLDDPTRGIDIGAKLDVYRAMADLAHDGVSMLLVSSELDELCALCHRVLVLVRGAAAVELGRHQLSRARLLDTMMGAAA